MEWSMTGQVSVIAVLSGTETRQHFNGWFAVTEWSVTAQVIKHKGRTPCALTESRILNPESLPPQNPQFLPHLPEGLQRPIQVFLFVRRRNLHADARLTFGHHGVGEGDDVNALL